MRMQSVPLGDKARIYWLENHFEDLLVGLVKLKDSKGVLIFKNDELTNAINEVRLLLREAEDRMDATSDRYRLEPGIKGDDQ